MNTLNQRFEVQRFANDYQLINGVVMHAENPRNFHIPPDVIKRQVGPGQYVELRIDSPRFSVHEDAREKCSCPSCDGEMTKPILRHEHPASLVALPEQHVPSRGWGEDFWVRIQRREGGFLAGVVDNLLVESRLHGLEKGDEIVFQLAHILAVHDVHRGELISGMTAADLKELAQWLGLQRRQGPP
jgi:hypothetical protein